MAEQNSRGKIRGLTDDHALVAGRTRPDAASAALYACLYAKCCSTTGRVTRVSRCARYKRYKNLPRRHASETADGQACGCAVAPSDLQGDGQAFGSGFFVQGSALTFGGTGTYTVADNIADQNGSGGAAASDGLGGTGGATSLTKNGSGTLILAGTNTFTGAVTVNGGTLQAASAGALGVDDDERIHRRQRRHARLQQLQPDNRLARGHRRRDAASTAER
jgi:autotransporter-associated beta strand protein